MNLRIIVLTPLVLLSSPIAAQSGDRSTQDRVALMILDRMCTTIGELTSCRFTLEAEQEVWDPELGIISHLTEDEVCMVGPDRMLVRSKGDQNDIGYWYNGAQVFYYSFTENNYASMKAPDTIIKTMDEMSRRYDIDFPAADLFYPTLVDDVTQNCDVVRYMGTSRVRGTDCFHIAGKGKKLSFELWIANDATTFPMKFILTTTEDVHSLRYDCTFTSWTGNPDLPKAIFEFMIPPGAKAIRIMSSAEKPLSR